MTNAQFYFGTAVGFLVAALGAALTSLGVGGVSLAAVGLLVLGVNGAYWLASRPRQRWLPLRLKVATVRAGRDLHTGGH